MLDDGNFTDSGDDLENDGTWSARLSFDDYDVGTYPYYARIVDVDGTSATETLSVVIYEAVSDEDAARMAEITQLVSALLDDEAFQEADQETRKQMADEMFAEMIAEGYVKEGSVEYDADTYWYTYLCESVGGLSDVKCILDIAIKEPNQVSSGSETDASCFTYTNHGDSIEITGFDNSVSDVVIPSEMEDLPVTTIGNMAFFGSSITSLVMPNTVIVIDDYAFMGCEALTDVTFSENLTTISLAAFSNCTSLSEVTIPQSVTSLEFSAFSKCTALTAVTILNADCEIYDSASTISNGSVLDASSEDVQQIPYYNGIIYGYADSTAQTYAETYGYAFAVIEESSSTGALRIIDENDDVSADIESEIIAQYAAAYPGVDLSDFSLVFLADQSAIYADYTSYYRFEMYYQDTYLLNAIVQVKVTAGGEVTASIKNESMINFCLTSLDSNYLSEEEILRYVCCEADDYILSDEPLSISLVVYTGDVTTSLTYAITYEHTDGERTFFLDAYTGMGLGWQNNWDDGIQYGWTGMMQLSYSKEDDGYTFTVESTYSDLDGWLTLADVDTGEDLAVMTEAGTTEDGYYRYTCSVTLPSDTDTTKTLYAYIEHDDLWPGDVSELEVSNFLTVDVSGTQTTETTTEIFTTTQTETTTETTTEATTTTENGSSIIGDVNLDGNVSLADSIFLNKYVAGLVDLSDIASANADTNADGYVDADDALVLLRFHVQLINSLPDMKS